MSGAWRIRSCLNKHTVLTGKASSGSNKQWVKQCYVQLEGIAMNKCITQLKHWEGSNWKCLIMLCFTVGKNVSKNDDTVYLFTNLSKDFTIIIIIVKFEIHSIIISLFVKSVAVIFWLQCWIMFIRNKVAEFIPPWWICGGMDYILLCPKLG